MCSFWKVLTLRTFLTLTEPVGSSVGAPGAPTHGDPILENCPYASLHWLTGQKRSKDGHAISDFGYSQDPLNVGSSVVFPRTPALKIGSSMVAFSNRRPNLALTDGRVLQGKLQFKFALFRIPNATYDSSFCIFPFMTKSLQSGNKHTCECSHQD